MDFNAGAGFPVKACVLFDHLRSFVRCNIDSELLTAAEIDLVLTIVSQLLNPKSDISSSAKLNAAAPVFKDASAVVLANIRPV